MLPQLDKFLADVVVEQGLPVAGAVVIADPALARFWLSKKMSAERDSWVTWLLTSRLPAPKRAFNRGAAVVLRRLVYADPAYFDAQGGQAWITRIVLEFADSVPA